MAQKQNIKETIYTVSKKLFYEYGYNATTTAQIADLSETSKGSIAYHYGTKAKLALAIYNDSLESIKHLVIQRYEAFNLEYDLQIATAIELRIMTKMFKDERLFRFYNELNCNGGFPIIFDDVLTHFWTLHDQKYNLNLDQGHDELKVIAVIARGMAIALLISFFNGLLPNASLESITEERIRVIYELMHLPASKIDVFIVESARIEELFKIKYLPYFTFE